MILIPHGGSYFMATAQAGSARGSSAPPIFTGRNAYITFTQNFSTSQII